jgi:hypothetical protein
MKSKKHTEQLKYSIKTLEWLKEEEEKCGMRVKLLKEEDNEEDNEEELKIECGLLGEILARVKFEQRNLQNIKSKTRNI